MAAAVVPIARVVGTNIATGYLTGNNNDQSKTNQIQKQLYCSSGHL